MLVGRVVTRNFRRAIGAVAIALADGVTAWPRACSAETIESALVQAYQNNPQLNAQRASTRAADEAIPQALSGYRPHVNLTGTLGEQHTDMTTKVVDQTGTPIYQRAYGTTTPWTAGATATQTVFDGFQTANRTRAAESQVSAAREGLRVMEQTVLVAAATAYMDVLRDTVDLEIQRNYVGALEETLKRTRYRFKAGEVTRTDVDQAEAQLAFGQFALAAAISALDTSRATYRQVVGTEPINLAPASPVDRFSPQLLSAAIDTALGENPNVTAAMYGVDVAHLQVKINEGALFPNLSLQGNVQQANFPQLQVAPEFTASIVGQLTVPIYQGGSEFSLVRQSKESLSQQRLNLDQVRNQTRQAVVQTWSQLLAAKTQIKAAQSQVTFSEGALNGIRVEARVGQRTTWDVLNAQQTLVNARVGLAAARHDYVVASYNLLAAEGRLSPRVLGLATTTYDPMVHYQQVRDAWAGIRLPDGR